MFGRIIFNIVPLLSNHVIKKITSTIIVVAFDDQSVHAIYIYIYAILIATHNLEILHHYRSLWNDLS